MARQQAARAARADIAAPSGDGVAFNQVRTMAVQIKITVATILLCVCTRGPARGCYMPEASLTTCIRILSGKRSARLGPLRPSETVPFCARIARTGMACTWLTGSSGQC